MLSRSSGLRTQIRIFVAIQNPSFSLNTDRHAIRNMCVPRHCPLQSIKNTAKFFLVQTRSLTFLFYQVKFNMIDQRVWVQERWNKRACPFSLSVASFGGAMKSCLSKSGEEGKSEGAGKERVKASPPPAPPRKLNVHYLAWHFRCSHIDHQTSAAQGNVAVKCMET